MRAYFDCTQDPEDRMSLEPPPRFREEHIVTLRCHQAEHNSCSVVLSLSQVEEMIETLRELCEDTENG